MSVEPQRSRVVRGPCNHVRGGALEHRDMGRPFGHLWNQSRGSSPASDHYDPLARIVQIRRPELRIDQCPLE